MPQCDEPCQARGRPGLRHFWCWIFGRSPASRTVLIVGSRSAECRVRCDFRGISYKNFTIGIPRNSLALKPSRSSCGHPKAPADARSTGALGSGSELQELAGSALDLEPLIVVRDRPRVCGGGDRHVPQGLDRPLLFDLVDRLDRLYHALAEPLREEGIQIVLDVLLAGGLDRLHDRLGRSLVILLEDGGDLFQPAIGGAFRMADANLGILVRP